MAPIYTAYTAYAAWLAVVVVVVVLHQEDYMARVNLLRVLPRHHCKQLAAFSPATGTCKSRSA